MNKHFHQLIKFGIVGVMNTLVCLAVIYLLMNVFHWDYKLSNITGYIAGLINSFIWNRNWTFRSTGKIHWELAKFSLVFGVCYLFQFLCLLLFVEKLKIDPNFAQPLAMIVYTLLNFVLNKLVTFRNNEN